MHQNTPAQAPPHRLKKLLDNAPYVLFALDAEGRFLEVSAACQKTWGYAAEALAGRSCLELVVEEDRFRLEEVLTQTRGGKVCGEWENRCQCPGRGIISVSWSLSWDEEEGAYYGTARALVGNSREVPKSCPEESFLERAFRLSGLAWWEWELDSNRLNASPASYEILGLNRNQYPELTPEVFLSFVHPQDASLFRKALAQPQEVTPGTFSHRLTQPSGEEVWLLHSIGLIKNGAGRIERIHGVTRDVSRWRTAHHLLKETGRKLTAILESIGDGFFAVDRDWKVSYWNRKAEELLGCKRAEVMGKHLWDVYSDAVSLRFYPEYHRAMANREAVHFEEYYPPLGIWVEVSAYPTEEGISVYFRNSTERKKHLQEREKAAEKLEQADRDLMNVLESMSDGFLTITRDWEIRYATDKVAALVGRSREDFVGKSLWELLPKETHDKYYTLYHRAFSENTFVGFEEYIGLLNRWVEVSVYPYRDVLSVYVKDITQKKNDARRLEFIARATSDVVWERDYHQEDIIVGGENFRSLFGYELRDSRISRSFWEQKLHPDDRAPVTEKLARAFSQGATFVNLEYRFQRSDASWAFVKDRTYIIRDEAGRPVKLIGAMEDVTPEQTATRALQESERSYRQLFDHASFPMAVYDRESLQILEVNDVAVTHYGYSREAFLNMTILDLQLPGDRQKVRQALFGCRAASRTDLGVWRQIKKGGEELLAHVSIATIHYKGQPASIATMLDVTENQRLQKELTMVQVRQQQRVTQAVLEAQEKERSAIGKELHDGINQVLATAKLYVENIRYFPDQKDTFIDKSTSLLQRSIEEIRLLSRALVTPVISDIGFTEALLELSDTYRELRQFEVEASFDLREAAVDKGLKLALYRIIQELFNNAVKYARASRVTVSIRMHKHRLTLEFGDNGVGFNPSQRKAGLGLRNIRNRAAAYRGTVHMSSAEGRGCRTKITFALPMEAK